MINIDSSYDVILTYSPINEITGHIFECFDYWLILSQKYKTGIMFLGAIPDKDLKTAWESKYIVPFEKVEPYIIHVSYETMQNQRLYMFGPKTVVLIADGNILSLEDEKIVFGTKKLLGFHCGNHEFQNAHTNRNIIYLQDDRIYGENKYFKSINYVKKLPFQFYKPINRVYDNTGMMYVTYACRKVTRYVIEDYHNRSGCNKTILVVPYKLEEYEDIPNVTQMVAPIDNFFEQFDTYIYTPVKRQFDCSPRLVTECMFYGKRVMLDLDYTDPGLSIRVKDMKENPEQLRLAENDQIFKIIEDVRNS